MRKKIISFLMVLALVLGLFSISPLSKEVNADAINLKSIIESATEDITIEISEDTSVDEIIKIPDGVNVTLKGKNNATLNMTKYIGGENSDLTLCDLNVSMTASNAIFKGGTGHKFSIYGGEISSKYYLLQGFQSTSVPAMYIYGGKINTEKRLLAASSSNIVYCPVSDIEVTTGVKEWFSSISVIAQNRHDIADCKINGESVSSEILIGMNGGTEAEPYQLFGKSKETTTEVKSVLFTVVSQADPTTGGSIQAEGYDVTWGYGGQVTAAEEAGQYVVTPKEGYAIEQIYVDGVLYAPETPYAGQTGAYTYTGDVPTRGMSVYFAYTVNFQNPDNGTLSVARGDKQLTSGEIVHGGEILTITYTDESGAYRLDEEALQAKGLTGIKYVEGTGYVVCTQNGEDTPKIDLTAEGVLVPLQKTAAPVFSPETGEVDAGDSVTLTADEGAVIYYTKDGSDPAGSSGRFVYSAPITVDKDMTIRAIAQKDGFLDSDETSASYTVRSYSLTAESEEGSTVAFTVDGESAVSAAYGKTVKAVVTPKEGRALVSLVMVTALGETDITDSLSFTMPKEAVNLKAEYMDKPSEPSITSVKTESDLKQLAQEVNAAGLDYSGITVKLENNIQLESDWTPIGTYSHPFRGSFDGQGYTVSNLNVVSDSNKYIGFFGYIEGSTVKNLTVSGKITSTYIDYGYIGGIVGYIYETYETPKASLVEGCTNYVDITFVSGWAGGIVGSAENNNEELTISNCINYGKIEGTALGSEDSKSLLTGVNLGGIAGNFGNPWSVTGTATISNCLNEGEITGTSPTVIKTDNKSGISTAVYEGGVCCGGLVSRLDRATISNSANHANVTGPARYQGGLVGVCDRYVKIADCYNSGDVTNTITYSWMRSRMGGLVGTSLYNQYVLNITNSYNTGEVSAPYYLGDLGNTPLYRSLRYSEIHANDFDYEEGSNIRTVCTNTYGASDIAKLDGGILYAATLNGSTGTSWKDSAVYGRPILEWETDPEPQECSVTFEITGADKYSLIVSKNKDLSSPETGENGKYNLMSGTYYYKVEAEGCAVETKSFAVTTGDKTLQIELKAGAEVTFNVLPADANAVLTLTDNSGKQVSPVSASNGVYKYSLYKGNVYNYTVKADGYVSIGRQIQPVKDDTVDITLVKAVDEGSITQTLSNRTWNYIREGGIYAIAEGTSGITISIATTEPVTLVGLGTAAAYKNIFINGVNENVDLTLQDLFITNDDKSLSQMTNLVNFTGKGNKLTFAGVDVLEQTTGTSGYALIHVDKNTELTISGETAYLYKSEQGAGIGGNGGNGTPLTPETNGKITFDGAKIFLKGTKQGAGIGSGAGIGTGATPGDIIVKNSELNLIANSRGSAIGGSAGETAAPGGNFYVDAGSRITVNVDFTGAAIGGGGFDAGNDSAGGTLVYTGGSLRTFLDTNAYSLWKTESVGVNGNKAITAKVVDESGNQLYLLTLDTSRFEEDELSVKDEEDTLLYEGSTHGWKYVNEDYDKESQSTITATISNWTELEDDNIYLYLTGENHTLDVNGTKLLLDWNAETKSFAVTCGEDSHSWKYEQKDDENHTMTCKYCNATDEEAHEWKDGVCEHCDYACVHETFIMEAATEATCTEDGSSGGIKCAKCDYYKAKAQVFPALGHNEVTDAAVSATCEHSGLSEGKHCTRCGEIIVAQQILDKLPHTIVDDAAVAATCEHSGLTAGKHCSVCKTVLVAQEFVERLEHNLEMTGYKTATCTQTGYTGNVVCTVCNKVVMKGTVIPMTNHAIVADKGYAATCEEDGLTDGAHCVICETVTKKQDVIPATGHKEVVIPGYPATATNTGLTDGIECSVCGKVIKAQKVIPKLAPDGWNLMDGNWYFYKDGAVQYGWISDSGKTYYTDLSTGVRVEGLKKVDGVWYYFNPNGKGEMLTGLQKMNGYWRYFDPATGRMQTGLQQINGYWRYFEAGTGRMLTGLQKIDGSWYYFESGTGRMQTGLQKINSFWRYFDPATGKMQTGLQQINGYWRYFDEETGRMQTGFQTINGKTYYFETEKGRALTGTQTINGKTYTFDKNGVLVK